jgi:hypothetical protein
MKKLIALLLLSPLAFAEEIEFNLNCKVTDQVIIETKDGVVQRYTGYKGKVKIGENFPIKFSYKTNKNKPTEIAFPAFNLTIAAYDPGSFLLMASSNSLLKARACDREKAGDQCDLPYYKDDDYLKRTFEGFLSDPDWDISPDEINGISINTLNSIYGGRVIGLKRYYKNDWELIFSSASLEDGIHNLTANCMGMPPKFDRLIQALREQYDKKY